MKNNELDDFLKAREAEFNVPFREEYWEKAQEMLRNGRRRQPAGWFNARIAGMTTAVLMLAGVATWYAATNQTVQPLNDTALESTSLPAPFMQANDTKETDAEGMATNAVQPFNPAANTAAANTAADARHTNKNSGNALSPAESQRTVSSRVSRSASTNVASNVSGSLERTASGATAGALTINDLDLMRAAMPALKNRSLNRIAYRNVSVIPVFEDMTPNDPVLLRYYGLYFSNAGSTSRKIREFKFGSQYPKISFAAVGGFNVFNHLKEHSDSLSYIATNPYIGMRIGYQWNPTLSLSVQPMLAQRGGVRLADATDDFVPASQRTAYRHLYYLQAPVMFGVQMSKRHNVSIGGGVTALLITGNRAQATTTGELEGPYKLSQSEGFHRFDVFAAAGYQFRLNKKVGFQAGFKYGLTDVTRNSHFADAQTHRNYQANIGVAYQLSQKKLHLR